MHIVDQAFIANKKKGQKTSSSSKQNSINPTHTKKGDKDEKKVKYCKAHDHIIKSCPKLAKELGMTIIDTSPSTIELANVIQDAEWAFSAKCHYDPSLHDVCMFAIAFDVWYFDNGATKHITSQCSFFTSIVFAPISNTVTCANNSSYPIEGVG